MVADFPGVKDASEYQRGEKTAGAEMTALAGEISDQREQREVSHDHRDHAGTIAAREHGCTHVKQRIEPDNRGEGESKKR